LPPNTRRKLEWRSAEYESCDPGMELLYKANHQVVSLDLCCWAGAKPRGRMKCHGSAIGDCRHLRRTRIRLFGPRAMANMASGEGWLRRMRLRESKDFPRRIRSRSSRTADGKVGTPQSLISAIFPALLLTGVDRRLDWRAITASSLFRPHCSTGFPGDQWGFLSADSIGFAGCTCNVIVARSDSDRWETTTASKRSSDSSSRSNRR
jgi:hypothetical protein